MSAPRLRPGPWLAERVQFAFAVGLLLATILILATDWGLA